MVSAGPAGRITKAGHISTSGRNAGTAHQSHWLASPGGPTVTRTNTRRQNGSWSGICAIEGAVEIRTWAWWSCDTGCGSGAIPAVRRVCSGWWKGWSCSRRKRRNQLTSPNPMSRWRILDSVSKWTWKWSPAAASQNRSCVCTCTPPLTEFTRLRFLVAYLEQSTFLLSLGRQWPALLRVPSWAPPCASSVRVSGIRWKPKSKQMPSGIRPPRGQHFIYCYIEILEMICSFAINILEES